MPMFRRIRLWSLISAAALCACLSATAHSQGKKLPGAPTARPPRSGSPPRVVQGPPKIIREKVEVKIGSLGVATEPGASVSLTPGRGGGKPQMKLADDSGVVLFENPRRGSYKVVASKSDYNPRTEQVTIDPRESNILKLDLTPVTYRLNIKVNATSGVVNSGTVRYSRHTDSSGIGNYCVLVFNSKGEAVIPDLRRGEYDIDVAADTPEFDNKRIVVSVPQDVGAGSDPAADTKTIVVSLANRKSTDIFSANAWADADWSKPPAWKIDRGMKVRDAEGIALPVNDRYRHYTDFELISNVKLNDSGSAGFVLRAKDQSNYYLLFLSGPKSTDGANTARLFIVKDGVKKYSSSLPIGVFSTALSSDKGFNVRILGDRTGFVLLMEDTDGKLHQAGKLVDDLSTFQIGAIGIAAMEKADFDIRQFQVCTPRCQQ